ncbi:MAG: tRNA (N6-isopentenyl adenosine(37)-C2)-methylthiotransferase MiaB [Pelagibacteraceae bacterium]|jgi:tRNA-2-methylthio-N6-dimethylallyladenosine synthase|nr:tRNA (N6-isopentenyl adenosine(37)-C2)-methylthiotransferase MiaB [Pelagibacteraceae bacterium]MBT3903171.1 tRNA (N6-isopentenyl adenosine(37)-C2)-methylthiotransferase MiaB [Pelagibacteraceae bacterium]MBT4645336.1 tRNA (N6-isopentenyl adenosine(37)-C2)-methylthiotransferase MiaB [Pelagibacteraceae bacterium]MBT4950771.1 tRNA (N6-isopentenyl adenosine(37)-C2)-methylthiotransferase MiaB [Pelagibacteraceae bacterium]MBT5213285.1 tRNA (N6-isopentenyl adenosine(37)-C2)-methylthiotransferase Mia
MKKNKIYIKSYGCQMNIYDSNRILDLFKNKDYVITKNPEDANLVVLNTCHIREKAAEKVYSDIGRINKIKQNRSQDDIQLVIAGCVAQAEGQEIKKRAPSVDYVVGPQSYHKLPEMLKKNDSFISDEFTQNEKFKNLLYNSSGGVSEFVSIQEGCDKFCSFCVVPYTRGPEFSRPVNEIVNEIEKYLKQGVKEIIFLGQNVNAYHGDGENGKSRDLAYLINKVSELESLKRIRYMTSHPIDMTNSLIKVHKTNNKLMPFLHLPIQSGSNKVLKKMNRKHTVEFYKKIVDKLRDERSDIALSSDFIVGYPDESDKDFEDTMKFVDEVKFVIAYSFMYSQRPGTPAQKKDNIPLAEKKARLSALQSLLKNQQKNYNNSFIEKNMEILFEKKGRYKNQYIGRSIYNQSVFINSEKNLINKVENVNIVRSTNFALESMF